MAGSQKRDLSRSVTKTDICRPLSCAKSAFSESALTADRRLKEVVFQGENGRLSGFYAKIILKDA